MLTRLLKVAPWGAGLVAIVAAATLFVSSPSPVGGSSAPNAREWVGAIHVHTVASDGGGTVDDVARAARAAGLDFVAITDHNAWAMPAPIYRDGRLLVLGEEASVPVETHRTPRTRCGTAEPAPAHADSEAPSARVPTSRLLMSAIVSGRTRQHPPMPDAPRSAHSRASAGQSPGVGAGIQVLSDASHRSPEFG